MSEREELRAARKLRLVTQEEAGFGVDDLPAGVYGFTSSPQTEGVPLFIERTFEAFEVHKLHDGSVHIVGYLTAEQAAAFAASSEAVDLNLYPEPYQEAQSVASVPRSRILKAKPVSRESGNWMPATVAPA
jgi:hypothetical protein